MAHTLKNHGNPVTEGKRGQLAVMPSDFALLPQIIQSGSYRHPEAHRGFHPRIVVTSEINGIGYHYVAEIRTGKKRFDMVSLRKKKGSW